MGCRSGCARSAAVASVSSGRRSKLGRPLVYTIKGSVLSNLKEFRPGSAGATEVRLLSVFDPDRQAVILVGGDKAGNWSGWYRVAVPQAEQAYAEHLKRIDGEDGAR
ncbi:type II toxin-antitoxin system RelE/ParE family toxin [Streptomyces sp. NPDC060053]|uniref:type II toxin-antitoxin system RelE/ParE family toxin n=1 Tax=Streptomyces sp. NPDC060053 TaxID=3347047 RepID=UPI00369DCE86